MQVSTASKDASKPVARNSYNISNDSSTRDDSSSNATDCRPGCNGKSNPMFNGSNGGLENKTTTSANAGNRNTISMQRSASEQPGTTVSASTSVPGRNVTFSGASMSRSGLSGGASASRCLYDSRRSSCAATVPATTSSAFASSTSSSSSSNTYSSSPIPRIPTSSKTPSSNKTTTACYPRGQAHTEVESKSVGKTASAHLVTYSVEGSTAAASGGEITSAETPTNGNFVLQGGSDNATATATAAAKRMSIRDLRGRFESMDSCTHPLVTQDNNNTRIQQQLQQQQRRYSSAAQTSQLFTAPSNVQMVGVEPTSASYASSSSPSIVHEGNGTDEGRCGGSSKPNSFAELQKPPFVESTQPSPPPLPPTHQQQSLISSVPLSADKVPSSSPSSYGTIFHQQQFTSTTSLSSRQVGSSPLPSSTHDTHQQQQTSRSNDDQNTPVIVSSTNLYQATKPSPPLPTPQSNYKIPLLVAATSSNSDSPRKPKRVTLINHGVIEEEEQPETHVQGHLGEEEEYDIRCTVIDDPQDTYRG